MRRVPNRVPQWVATIIALAVTAVWVGSFIADVLIETYEPHEHVHIAFLGVLGAAFGVQMIRRDR